MRRRSLIGCVVCGLPGNACRLVRLTWRDDPAMPLNEAGLQLRIVVAKVAKANDVMVCDECIRGIKRLPFSDLPEAPA